MLAVASPVGDNYLLILGPVIVVLAIVAFVSLTVVAGRRRDGRGSRHHHTGPGHPHRRAVQGGVIEGDPAQRNRHDEAPRQD
jgi:hypothetical protein